MKYKELIDSLEIGQPVKVREAYTLRKLICIRQENRGSLKAILIKLDMEENNG